MDTLDPEALYRAGLEALRKELGVVGMTRFLQQIAPGRGDYTAERHQWLREDEDLEKMVEEANRIAASGVGTKAN